MPRHNNVPIIASEDAGLRGRNGGEAAKETLPVGKLGPSGDAFHMSRGLRALLST